MANKNHSSVIDNIKWFVPKILKKHPFYLILNIIFVILDAIKPLINVVLYSMIIEELVSSRDFNTLILYVLILFGLTFTCSLLISFLKHKISLMDNRMSDYFYSELNCKSMKLSYEDCEDPSINDLRERVFNGLSYLPNGFTECMFIGRETLKEFIRLFSVLSIIVFAKIPYLLIISLLHLLYNFWVAHKNNKMQIELLGAIVRLNRKWNYLFYDLLEFRYAKDMRLYHVKDSYKNISLKENKKITNEFLKLDDKEARLSIFSSIFTYLIENFLVFYILIVFFKDDVSTLVMLLSSFTIFNASLYEIVLNILKYRKTIQYQSYYIDYMLFENDKESGNIIPSHNIECIEFKNVSFKYPNSEDYILKNINFKINGNERVSLVGLNGSGKSTLVKLLCRLYDVKEGEILVNGINIKEYDYNEYLKLFSVVFQDFKLISFTIKENIEKAEDNPVKLDECIVKSGVSERISYLKNKENTYITKKFSTDGVEFSGGELQKIAISRALYKDSPIVILDEPTAALDPVAEMEIYEKFNEVIGDKPSIFISHRLSSCKFSDRIIMLSGCTIVEEGSHENLMKIKNGKYKEIFELQAKYYKE